MTKPIPMLQPFEFKLGASRCLRIWLYASYGATSLMLALLPINGFIKFSLVFIVLGLFFCSMQTRVWHNLPWSPVILKFSDKAGWRIVFRNEEVHKARLVGDSIFCRYFHLLILKTRSRMLPYGILVFNDALEENLFRQLLLYHRSLL